MFKEWKRKRRVFDLVYQRERYWCKGRFEISCHGLNQYSIFDKVEKEYIDDELWKRNGTRSTSWVKRRQDAINCPSIIAAKDTIDSVITVFAKSRFRDIINSYHRVKNKPISYT